MQAQDRAHRIGQTKPVLVYRLITANTIEANILQRANQKRKLEALVIGGDTFRIPGSGLADILSGKRNRKEKAMTELAEVLLRQDGEATLVKKGDVVISDEQLETLLDRSVSRESHCFAFVY